MVTNRIGNIYCPSTLKLVNAFRLQEGLATNTPITAPVWALLQPRDYLNSYLLIFMIVGAVIRVNTRECGRPTT